MDKTVHVSVPGMPVGGTQGIPRAYPADSVWDSEFRDSVFGIQHVGSSGDSVAIRIATLALELPPVLQPPDATVASLCS